MLPLNLNHRSTVCSMIDIHCHILPGVDDGPTDTEQALAMAKIAVKDGITGIIATPHISDSFLDAEEIARRTKELNQALKQEGIPLTIYPGAELPSHYDLAVWGDYTLNNGKYILIEFPHSHFPSVGARLLEEGINQSFWPIIAHPERNPGVMRNPNLLEPLIKMGVKIQITAESIVGTFGPAIQQCAHYLLRRNLVHFIATDGHPMFNRQPRLAVGLKTAEKILGKGKGESLVQNNPAAVLANRPI